MSGVHPDRYEEMKKKWRYFYAKSWNLKQMQADRAKKAGSSASREAQPEAQRVEGGPPEGIRAQPVEDKQQERFLNVFYIDCDHVDPKVMKAMKDQDLADYQQHECDQNCAKELFSLDENKSMNRFLKPFYFGFRRLAVTDVKKVGLHERQIGQMVYRTLCGKILVSLPEVSDCLKVMKLDRLELADFTFSPQLHFVTKPRAVFNYLPDIAGGKEARPVPFYNFHDQKPFVPPGGLYLAENAFDESVPEELKRQSTTYCTPCPCEPGAPQPSTGQKSEFYSNKLLMFKEKRISECGSQCPCDESCGTRVVSRGIKFNIAVTSDPRTNGFKVVAMQFIPRGSFICNYTGVWYRKLPEHLNDSSYNLAFEDPGLLDQMDKCLQGSQALQHQDWQNLYYINNERDGNLGRYFNHSCAPNVFVQKVYCGHQMFGFPLFSLFTSRDIMADEELTWDYNSPSMLSQFYCLCDHPRCEGYIPSLALPNPLSQKQ